MRVNNTVNQTTIKFRVGEYGGLHLFPKSKPQNIAKQKQKHKFDELRVSTSSSK